MAGLQPNVYAAVFITMPAAIVALVLRLLSRRMIKMKYWFDDWFCVIAYIFALAYCIDVVYWTANYSLGQTLPPPGDPSADHIREISRLCLWLEEVFYTISLAFSKLSILSFYWRIFQHTSIRIPIQIIYVAVVIWALVKWFLTIFQCVPIRFIWDKDIHGHCTINVSNFFFSTVLCHCILDILILLLPVFPVAKMHLSLSKKLAVTTIFHSGVIVCVASVFVLIESWKYNQETVQLPHDSALFTAWGAVEVNMAVFAGCLPTLKPIFRKAFPTVGGLSTEHTRSRDGRQTTPPRMWRFRRSDKKKNDTESNTVTGPVHLENVASHELQHAGSRPPRDPLDDLSLYISDVESQGEEVSEIPDNSPPQR
ncbi:hypothetical protein BU24DRAFT_426952 [Aaosphaeria arxii CBS 175.79]|uniref:Rhodopsin domain-containing protein n=1 Tax=Aaosphaeria arxii CBS 175.79 TaxID=1450172 RepID=A0A6A5XCW4_9PLEO|nr:uncharacterized protein BU24DRAFT_426952 [Aaosphaeria arxii CBS 175.79]KAF2010741.1 hypothetical protein BU24DRAFT_426952 [Aaosphaeria arxii CBS 175.79]